MHVPIILQPAEPLLQGCADMQFFLDLSALFNISRQIKVLHFSAGIRYGQQNCRKRMRRQFYKHEDKTVLTILVSYLGKIAITLTPSNFQDLPVYIDKMIHSDLPTENLGSVQNFVLYLSLLVLTKQQNTVFVTDVPYRVIICLGVKCEWLLR